MLTSVSPASQPLYRRLAADYVQAIGLGTLQAGERMPSVRELMRRHQVSLSTALQVLRHLEEQGYLEAKPRVGYFVRDARTPQSGSLALTSEPDLSQPVQPNAQAHFVGINEHISLLLERGRQADVHLDVGGCTPPPALFDHRYLNQLVTRLLREQPTLLVQGRSLLANQGNHPVFQQAMARRALASGIRVAPLDVLATTGNSEAVSLALAAVASPGDMVAVESPTYYGLLQVVESLQRHPLVWRHAPLAPLSAADHVARGTGGQCAGVAAKLRLRHGRTLAQSQVGRSNAVAPGPARRWHVPARHLARASFGRCASVCAGRVCLPAY